MQQHPAGSRGGVDALGKRAEAGAGSLKALEQVQEVLEPPHVATWIEAQSRGLTRDGSSSAPIGLMVFYTF